MPKKPNPKNEFKFDDMDENQILEMERGIVKAKDFTKMVETIKADQDFKKRKEEMLTPEVK